MAKGNSRVSGLDSHIGFWLRYVSNHVSVAFARKLTQKDITVAEWVVLRQLYEHEQLIHSILAELAGLTRGACTKVIDRLIAKKLVSRHDRTDDRRFQDIALTPAGKHLVPALAAIADANDAEFFSPLTKLEREALVGTLRKLVTVHGLHKFPRSNDNEYQSDS